MLRRIAPLLLLWAMPLAAQTVTNGSFETLAPLSNGTWGNGNVPNWTTQGAGGLWQPGTPSAAYSALPDGKQVLWLGAGSASQDSGQPGAANTNYLLTAFVGYRLDYQRPSNYTISLAVNGGIFCTTGGNNSAIPPGTWLAVKLPCPMGGVPTSGNLSVILSSDGGQVNFDNVTLTSTPNTPPTLTMLNLNVKILLCTVCNDGTNGPTDDSPFNGSGSIAQTNGPTQTFQVVNGAMSINSGWDFGQPDPLEFTFTLSNSVGQIGAVQQKIYKVLMPTATGNITGLVRIDAKTFLLRGVQEAFGQ